MRYFHHPCEAKYARFNKDQHRHLQEEDEEQAVSCSGQKKYLSV